MSRPKADPKGYCTVGYGHLIRMSACTAADMNAYANFTQATATSLLQADLGGAQTTVRSSIRSTPLAQTEFDSLVDFVANVGSGQYSTSSVQRDLAASPPRYANVKGDYMLWTADKLCGLYRRRIDEGNLFANGSYALTSAACPSGYK